MPRTTRYLTPFTRQTTGEFAADLRRHLGGELILARPAGPLERAVKWVKRSPTAAALAAWTKAGAVVGWMGHHEYDFTRFQTASAGLTTAVPAFRFDKWQEGLLAKLPDSVLPFGFNLVGTQVTDAGIEAWQKALLSLSDNAVVIAREQVMRRTRNSGGGPR